MKVISKVTWVKTSTIIVFFTVLLAFKSSADPFNSDNLDEDKLREALRNGHITINGTKGKGIDIPKQLSPRMAALILSYLMAQITVKLFH